MKLINLTPHTVTIIGDYCVQEIPPSGNVARVDVRVERIGSVIKNVPLVVQRVAGIDGLPAPQEGVGYIVSNMVLQALKAQGIERSDCYAPDTSPEGAVKNYHGKIIGVRGLTQTVIAG
jgi:hypothetical protein